MANDRQALVVGGIVAAVAGIALFADSAAAQPETHPGLPPDGEDKGAKSQECADLLVARDEVNQAIFQVQQDFDDANNYAASLQSQISAYLDYTGGNPEADPAQYAAYQGWVAQRNQVIAQRNSYAKDLDALAAELDSVNSQLAAKGC